MGSVFNRSKRRDRPAWTIRYKDVDGRRRWMATHKPTKAQALRYLDEIEARVADGRIGIEETSPARVARHRLTLEELGERFIADYSSPRVKNITKYRREAGYLLRRHVFPSLGHMRVVDVERRHLNRLCERLLTERPAVPAAGESAISRTGKSRSTVRSIFAGLSRMYNWARIEGIITCSNPIPDVDKPSVSGREREFAYLERAEVERLLAWAAKNQPDEYPLYATAVYTGMRMGELYGLRWTDINFELGQIAVLRSYRTTPKSDKSRRVPLNEHLRPILLQWRARWEARRCATRFKWGDRTAAVREGLVFPSERGFMRNKDKDYGFGAALAGARCHEIGFHGMRHTYASHFVMAGGSLRALKEILGHHSITTTEKYAHLAPDYMKAEAGRVSFNVEGADELHQDEPGEERPTDGAPAG
jgi:integrase